MKNLDIAKKNYSRGLWTDDMVGRLVARGKLTASEYEEVTGQPYTGEAPATMTTAELDAAYTEGVNEA